MPIGQISFMRMDGPVERPYGSRETSTKYQGQAEPTPSRFYLNFERRWPSPAGRHAPLPWAEPCGLQAHSRSCIVLVVVLVIFGPKRLPDLGRSLGRGMREFKDSVTGKDKDELPEGTRRARPSPTTVTTATRAQVLAAKGAA